MQDFVAADKLDRMTAQDSALKIATRLLYLAGQHTEEDGFLAEALPLVRDVTGGSLALLGRDNPRYLDTGKKLLHTAAILALASLLILVFLLLAHDYRVAYVRDYADRTMSTAYLFMAIWGGQAGSLLLWAALQSFFTSAVALWGGGRQGERLMPVALFSLATLQVFFLLVFMVSIRLHIELGSSPGTRAFESIAAVLVGIAGGWAWSYAIKNHRLLLPEVTEQYAYQLRARILAEPITAIITIPVAFFGSILWELSWLSYPLVVVLVRRRPRSAVVKK